MIEAGVVGEKRSQQIKRLSDGRIELAQVQVTLELRRWFFSWENAVEIRSLENSSMKLHQPIGGLLTVMVGRPKDAK